MSLQEDAFQPEMDSRFPKEAKREERPGTEELVLQFEKEFALLKSAIDTIGFSQVIDLLQIGNPGQAMDTFIEQSKIATSTKLAGYLINTPEDTDKGRINSEVSDIATRALCMSLIQIFYLDEHKRAMMVDFVAREKRRRVENPLITKWTDPDDKALGKSEVANPDDEL